MFNYGVGGQEVKQDAPEAITDLSQNRTLFVQKLTHEEQFTPQVVYDLKLWMKSLIFINRKCPWNLRMQMVQQQMNSLNFHRSAILV